MEHFQTESPSNYQSSKIKHTVLVGKGDLEASKSDDEYASSGFYVREKNDSKSVETPESSCDKDNIHRSSENGDVQNTHSEEENNEEENESVQGEQKPELEGTGQSEEHEDTESCLLNVAETDKDTSEQSLVLNDPLDSNGESDYLTPESSLKDNGEKSFEQSENIINDQSILDNGFTKDSDSEESQIKEKNDNKEDSSKNDSETEVTQNDSEIMDCEEEDDESHKSATENNYETEDKMVEDTQIVSDDESKKVDIADSEAEEAKNTQIVSDDESKKVDIADSEAEEVKQNTSEPESKDNEDNEKEESESEILDQSKSDPKPKENDEEKEDIERDKPVIIEDDEENSSEPNKSEAGTKRKEENDGLQENQPIVNESQNEGERDINKDNADKEDSPKEDEMGKDKLETSKPDQTINEDNADNKEDLSKKDETGTEKLETSKPDQRTNVDNADKKEDLSKKDETGKDKLESFKPDERNENNTPNNEPADEEDMEYEFDPSLLCPDISMDVDEAPVITNNDNAPNDGNTSPLPYEQSFSTYVDEMTGAETSFDLTPDEVSLKEKLFGPLNPIQFTKVHCTACNVHLGSALDGQKNRFVHPLLKVLICKNCYHFYTSGEFEKDEDGSELYCRWCGQGGQVLCCSSCEFVFCKRCIKNNFGLKKFKEIRDSDDWNCFRCEPQQLSILRASCAEFIDYVRRETAKASTLAEDVPSFMAVDHTTCCNASQKKKDGEKAAQPPRRKRKMSTDDPDFNPKNEEPEVKKVSLAPIAPMVSASPGVVLLPRTIASMPNRVGVVQMGRPPGAPFRVGQTSFRPRIQPVGYTVTRPSPQVQNRPNFIKVLPPRMLNTSRPQMLGTMNTSSMGTMNTVSRPTFSTIRPRPQTTAQAQPPQMKHEWFEKTVRAAARVNSNLSYTLTQLNRQQSTATSVEGLALIHNKLQEVLSTSINSLIQIRKNLRTEFIAGIKNIKFPPKAAVVLKPPVVNNMKDDDDVIFVNPTTASSLPVPPMISLPSAITLTSLKKTAAKTTGDDIYSNPTPSTSYTVADTSVRKGGYLKVKSFSALQNVSSECITIPDDPLPPPPALTPIRKLKQLLTDNKDNDVTVINESPEKNNESPAKNDEGSDNKDSKHDDDDVVEIIDDKKEDSPKILVNGDSSNDSDKTDDDETKQRTGESILIEDLESHIKSDSKLNMGAFIHLERCKEIDEILKQQEVANGDT